MQQQKNSLKRLFAVVVAVVALSVTASAQTSSINAFSPYTMYGIGEINTPGTLAMRSMGGVGVAARQTGMINLLNPAGFSLVTRKSFLLDVALEGQNYYNYQTVEGAEKKSAYNSFNIREFAFLMPLAKNLGLGFSVTPYSSVGYRMMYDHVYDASDPVWGHEGRVNYSYQGEGDVTEVKVGIGYEVVKNLSIGVAMQYYWGDIDRAFVMTPVSITGNGSYGSVSGNSEYAISNIKAQFGVQWNALLTQKRVLTFGATYDIGGDLNPDVTSVVTGGDLYGTAVAADDNHLSITLPRQLTIGAFYQTAKWAIGLDYTYQEWTANKGSENTGVSGVEQSHMVVAYTDTHTIKAGMEFVPARYDTRRFWRRWSYRLGVRYGSHNQTFDGHKLQEYAVTAGFGIPIKFLGISSVDFAVEYGDRGFNVAKEIGLVRQKYVKFGVGFKLFAGAENHEYWFLRPKYD